MEFNRLLEIAAERAMCDLCVDYGNDACITCPKVKGVTATELREYHTAVSAALRRTAEDDKAREEGRLVILPSATLEQRTMVEMAMGFKLYNWQAAYIWADSNYIPPGRMVGSSTAFALRLLLVPGEALHMYPGGRQSHLSDGAASGYEYIRWFQRFLQDIYRHLLQSRQPLALRRVYFSLREAVSLGGGEGG